MAKVGSFLAPGQKVVTGSDGKVALLLADETAIRLNSNSEFVLNSSAETAGWLTNFNDAVKSKYKLLQGELWFRNKRRAADIEIDTDHISISVRGTEFTVIAEAQRTLVNMLEGKVNANNEFGAVDAISGEQVIAEAGKAPIKRILLQPQDAVQWMVRAPASFNSDSLFDGTTEHTGKAFEITQQAWQSYQADRYSEAYQLIHQDASTHSYLPAQRLKALTGLITNRNQQAASAIAFATDHKNAMSEDWILRSYIEQSQFDLKQAERSSKIATELSPKSAEAWLQRARIAMGFGNYGRARKFVDRAVSHSNSQDAEILAAAGFVYSALGKFNQASDFFQAALNIDETMALAHVGAALESTRNKTYSAALESISKAVAIEPANASLLVYYGKILYTVERKQQALEVLQRASELDPNDPSPIYIMAIIERDRHRDAKAIELLQRAETLNDNKGIYRSKQLLDTDRATNSADLTLAYDPFDFLSWSEYTSRNAIEQSPENYNAHLMYASALSRTPDRQLAFAAANFRSRLLTPFNATVLDIPNDYTSFFEQSNLKGEFEVTGGSDDQKGVGLLLFGNNSTSKVFASILASKESSAGYTGTFDEESKNFSSIFKWDPNYKYGFTLQALSAERDQRDRLLLRSNSSIDSDIRDRFTGKISELSLGMRFKTGKHSTLLASIGKYRNDIELVTHNGAEDNEESNSSSVLAQLQYSNTWNWLDYALGATHIDESIDYRSRHFADPLASSPPPNPMLRDASTKLAPRFTNAYIKTNFRVNEKTRFDLTALYEKMRTGDSRFRELSETDINQALLALIDPPPSQSWEDERVNIRAGFNLSTGFANMDLAYIESLFTTRPDRLDPFQHSGLIFLKPRAQGTFTKESQLRLEIPFATGYFNMMGFYEKNSWESRHEEIYAGSTTVQVATGESQFNNQRRSGGSMTFNFLLTPNIGISLDADYLRSDGRQFLDGERKLQSLGINATPLREDPSNREEHMLSTTLALTNHAGISLKLSQEYRDVGFASNNDNSNQYIQLSNLSLEWELPNTIGIFQLDANNLFDEQFDYFEEFFSGSAPTPSRTFEATIGFTIQ